MLSSEDRVAKEAMVVELYSKAKHAYELYNYDYAITLFRNVLAIYPDFVIARHLYHMAITQAHSRRTKGLIKKIKVLFYFYVKVLKAFFLHFIKKDLDAIYELEGAFEIDSEKKWVLYHIANIAKANDMEDTAISVYEELTGFSFMTFECCKHLSFIHLERKDLKQAQQYFDRAIQINPTDKDILRGMKDLAALGTIEKGMWEGEGDFTEKLKDKELTEKLKRAQSTIDKKTKEEAEVSQVVMDQEIKDALLLLKDKPDDSTSLQKVRSFQLSRAKIIDFISQYKDIMRQAQPGSASFKFLGDLYTKAALWQEAFSAYKKSYDLDKQPETLMNLKESELILIQTEIHERSKAGKSSGPGTLDEKELSELRDREFNAVLDITKKKLALHPTDAALHFKLGGLYKKQGLLDNAVSEFQRSIEMPKFRLKSLIALGACFVEKEMYDLAGEQYNKALERIPTMDENKKHVLYMLGHISLKLNNLDTSKTYYKQIYEVDIKYKDVARKLEDLYKKS